VVAGFELGSVVASERPSYLFSSVMESMEMLGIIDELR
jgi:hypothetical protein